MIIGIHVRNRAARRGSLCSFGKKERNIERKYGKEIKRKQKENRKEKA